jgi:hypothetical protein
MKNNNNNNNNNNMNIMSEQEKQKYAELLISMSTDYLLGKITESHYKSMLKMVVNKFCE